jgi:hypothetical protein
MAANQNSMIRQTGRPSITPAVWKRKKMNENGKFGSRLSFLNEIILKRAAGCNVELGVDNGATLMDSRDNGIELKRRKMADQLNVTENLLGRPVIEIFDLFENEWKARENDAFEAKVWNETLIPAG